MLAVVAAGGPFQIHHPVVSAHLVQVVDIRMPRGRTFEEGKSNKPVGKVGVLLAIPYQADVQIAVVDRGSTKVLAGAAVPEPPQGRDFVAREVRHSAPFLIGYYDD